MTVWAAAVSWGLNGRGEKKNLVGVLKGIGVGAGCGEDGCTLCLAGLFTWRLVLADGACGLRQCRVLPQSPRSVLVFPCSL